MKKLLKLCALSSIILMSGANASQYIPSQLEQFKQTGICIDCDLSEASLPSHDNANLSGALLVKSDFFAGGFYTSNFNRAQIMYADLRRISASGSTFVGTNLTGSDLSGANLSSCDLTNANLTGVNLSNADLARAIVTNEQLTSAKTLSCAIMPDGSRHSSDSGTEC